MASSNSKYVPLIGDNLQSIMEQSQNDYMINPPDVRSFYSSRVPSDVIMSKLLHSKKRKI